MFSEPNLTPDTTLSTESKSISPLHIVGALVLVGVAGAAFMMRPKAPDSMEQPTPLEMTQEASTTNTGAATSELMMADEGTQVVTLEAGAFYYKPSEITIKKGQKVRIVMNSVDMMHDFVIDDLGVKLPITKAGETNMVEFTADQVGTFEFYCSVGEHRQNGQVGTLIVQE